jgi:hypothetical protein
MNLLIGKVTLLLLIMVVLFTSCLKEYSCEGCNEKNTPPIANAGQDTTLILPTDSTLLDGSASSDPDGQITKWLWTKIAGPDAFTIINESHDSAQVKNLVVGVYLFELTVTDNGGLSAKDTVQIRVDSSLIQHPPIACAGEDLTITLPVSALKLDGSCSTDPDNDITTYQWKKIEGPATFTISNSNTAQTQVADLREGVYLFELKVIDARGLFSLDTVQVRVQQATVNLPCDGSNRPIVQARLVPFSTLSKARMGIAVATAGTKILFAGGYGSADCPDCWGSSRVDIYDTVTHQWSTAELSRGRFGIAAVTVGNKIFFAGGENGDGAFDELYATVDIYDAASNTWSVASLSEPRSYIAAAAVGNKVLFAGGGGSDLQFHPSLSTVDIYDLHTNTWSTAALSVARSMIAGVTVGEKVYFAGGVNSAQGRSNRIDIYDNATGA